MFNSIKLLYQPALEQGKQFKENLALLLKLEIDHKKSLVENFSLIEERVKDLCKQLAESKSKELAILNNAVDVIGLIDTNSCFVSVNPAAKTVFGYAPDELLGRPLAEFVQSDDIEATLNAAVGAEKSIEKVVFENRWRRKDGTIINLLWSAHWSASDHGLFCVVHDITQRKLAETMLRESEEKIRLILESLPLSLFISNRMGLIEQSNSTAEKQSGYSRTELFGKQLRELLPDLLKSDSTLAFKELSAQLSNHSRESIMIRKNGESFPAEFSMRELQSRGETKYLLAAVDITERYELDKAKREFVAMVSHDLRSPLSNILITLSILEDGKLGELSERAKRHVSEAHEETERLIELIKDLLDLEKLDDSKFSMRFENVSLRNIVISSLDALRRSAESKQLTVETSGTDLECEADGARLIQVMVNLLSNAIKFSPSDSKIFIALEDSGEFVRISVSDSGRGIPLDKQADIFDKFAQVEQDDWQKKGGSGLGLAICKKIIEQHDGKIGLKSLPGEGSTFWFEIPKKRS